MTNELKKIVKEIQFRTDKTIEEIATEIGYARAYFTNQVNIGTNKKLKDLLIKKFPRGNEQNVRYQDNNDVPTVKESPVEYYVLPLGDLKVTLKDYVELLIETKRKAEEREREAEERERELLSILKKDIGTIKTNSKTIQDDLSQVARMVRTDDLTTMDALDRIEGREAGTSSIEAGIVERAFGAEEEDIDTNENKSIAGKPGKEKKRQS